jgi:large subunit ribosomal protein L13
MIVYDAKNQILGRLCSVIAKKLLEGEKVVVINCESAIISGNKEYTIKKYLERLHRGDPKKGPFFPKQPNGIFRRAVRGMLPWHKKKGREAYKRLKVFIGLPKEFENMKLTRVENAEQEKLKKDFITLGELSVRIGGKKVW